MSTYWGKGMVPKPQKCQNITISAVLEPIWGAAASTAGRRIPQKYLTLKKYTILKSVFKDLPYDTGFVTL